MPFLQMRSYTGDCHTSGNYPTPDDILVFYLAGPRGVSQKKKERP
jgi:hypothetical protein